MRKLRELRKAVGLTQGQAAAQIGVNQSSIAMWETGRNAPRMHRFRKIAEVYRCSIEELAEIVAKAESDSKTRGWLIDIRRDRDLLQKEVAGEVGIDPSTYCDIEKGKYRPNVETAKRIGAVLGFEWTRFYED